MGEGVEMVMEKLLEDVRQIAYGVHVYLGNGYLEKVYENCLRHRLEKAGYAVEAQKRLEVRDEDREDLAVYIEDESFADLMHTFLYVMKNASRSGGLCCDKVVDKEEQYE